MKVAIQNVVPVARMRGRVALGVARLVTGLASPADRFDINPRGISP